jgi:hypothetical protein
MAQIKPGYKKNDAIEKSEIKEPNTLIKEKKGP